MKLAAQYDVSKWEVFMEHLDWLLTESKFVFIITDFISSHAHFVVQTSQSGDAESHESVRCG